jgi:uncharacterized membrane protein YfcA
MIWQYLGALLTGVVVGFLGGLFGKGGSAVATPLLSLLGFPGFVAVASPLPATMPGTLIASVAYWRSNLLDWEVVWWSVAVGVPTIIIGSLLSQVTGAKPLLIATALLVLGFGLSFLFFPEEKVLPQANHGTDEPVRPAHWKMRLTSVSAAIGLVSGLLANSGGFLLAPSYSRFLRQPIKKAFACSLAVSAVLALPGTIVHAWLGHVSWLVAGLVAAGALPFSYLGARLAIRTRAARLERWYGLALTALGIFFLFRI